MLGPIGGHSNCGTETTEIEGTQGQKTLKVKWTQKKLKLTGFVLGCHGSHGGGGGTPYSGL